MNRAERYIEIRALGHPKGNSYGFVREHILIAENALGKALPDRAEIHHLNEIKHDNRNCNLVICEDRAYHLYLHQRTRAYKACGHGSWRICCVCKKYDDPKNLRLSKTRCRAYHRSCEKAMFDDLEKKLQHHSERTDHMEECRE